MDAKAQYVARVRPLVCERVRAALRPYGLKIKACNGNGLMCEHCHHLAHLHYKAAHRNIREDPR